MKLKILMVDMLATLILFTLFAGIFWGIGAFFYVKKLKTEIVDLQEVNDVLIGGKIKWYKTSPDSIVITYTLKGGVGRR